MIDVMMDGADLAEGGATQTFDENGQSDCFIKIKKCLKI